MTRPKYKLEWIETKEQFDRLEVFAKSFDHKPYFNPNLHRMCLVSKDEKLIGYCFIPKAPLIFTSWDPNSCSPRDVAEMAGLFSSWSQVQYGETYVAVPNTSETFTETIMNKLGFYPLNCGVYSADILV